MSDTPEIKPYEIVCGETMDISMVANVHSQLVEALASGQTITLDGKQVERADTAALQTLVAFFQDATAENKTVQWIAPSEILCRSAALLGLSELLHLELSSQ